MLQASLADGTLITPAQLTKEKVERYRSCKFYCPTCRTPVILKAGDKVIPHFAHKDNSVCTNNMGGESKTHYEGKLLLYNWLKHQGMQVQLEKYLPTLNQQPDILISFDRKQIAIEYQCSSVSVQSIRQRTANYLKESIQPIWLLSPQMLQRVGSMKLKITPFLKQFIHQFSTTNPQSMYFFCPTTKNITIIQHIYFSTQTVAYGNIKYFPLKNLNFLHLFHTFYFDQRKLYQNWFFDKQHFRTKVTGHLYGQPLLWNQWIYDQGLYVQYLPSVIHLPTASQIFMKSPPWDWQSRIYLNLIHPKAIGATVTLDQCMRLLRRHLHNVDYFPLINKSVNAPIEEYLSTLCMLNILEHAGVNKYIIKNKAQLHGHIESAIKADRNLVDYIQQQLKQSTKTTL